MILAFSGKVGHHPADFRPWPLCIDVHAASLERGRSGRPQASEATGAEEIDIIDRGYRLFEFVRSHAFVYQLIDQSIPSDSWENSMKVALIGATGTAGSPQRAGPRSPARM